MAFLVWDQHYWWSHKEDYTFGYLVPFFVAYVIYDRWPRILGLLGKGPEEALPSGILGAARALALAVFAGSALMFAFGAFYRAGAGPSNPGSLALALGFCGLLLSMVYLNQPERAPEDGARPARGMGLRSLMRSPRFQVAALFLFPALVWVVSAPLLSVVENNLSMFLLNQVTVVVFFTFDMLGLPLERQGNILILPEGQVGVAEACSGIRSLTACLFAGSFLAAVFLNAFWKKVALVALAMLFAFFTNLLRSLFLTAWAYAYGPEAIDGAVHDVTGYAVLGLTSIGLICLLPVFNLNLDKLAEEIEPRPPPVAH